MNFKPTLWKTIISLIVGILVDIYISSNTKALCLMIEGRECIQPNWYSNLLNPAALLISLIIIILIYLIWSYFQKRK